LWCTVPVGYGRACTPGRAVQQHGDLPVFRVGCAYGNVDGELGQPDIGGNRVAPGTELGHDLVLDTGAVIGCADVRLGELGEPVRSQLQVRAQVPPAAGAGPTP